MMFRLASAIAVAALAGCAAPVVRPVSAVPATAPPAAVENARPAFAAGPGVASLSIDAAQAGAALAAFRMSCKELLRRGDRSGLTQPGRWDGVCARAAEPGIDPRTFFVANFETVQVGDGSAFATGYYEPEIAGARQASDGFPVPVYRMPDDLIEADLGTFNTSLKGKAVRGRVEGRQLVPYPDRAAIEDGALAGRGLEIAWAADPVELFFLEVQGSGRLRLPDGGVMRLGYAGQNGHAYTGIGALMRQRGLLAPGQLSMQGIMAYLRAHPEEGRAIMRENKSYVFFRELTGPGPIGAMGVAVTPRASVAVDPQFVPLGAPVFLALDRPEASGLWIAQDTGGAIKGANRFDTFWGAGADARTIAGGMSARGTAYVLVPKTTPAETKTDASPQP